MTIKEYITAYGDILTELPPYYNGIFGEDHKVAINQMLKYNYPNKSMVYSTESEVADVVNFVMFENRFKYSNGNKLVSFELPDYTLKDTDISTKTNTGTQINSGTDIKDNTGTQTIAKDFIKDNTGTQKIEVDSMKDNTGTQTIENTGTVKNTGTDKVETDDITTIDPNDTTKSVLGFDGGALVANEKNANSINKTTLDGLSLNTQDLTSTNDLTNLRTDLLKEVVDDTNLRTDLLKEVVSDTNLRTDALTEVVEKTTTRTDLLTEGNNSTHTTTDIALKVELMEKMVGYTENKRLRLVCEDLIAMLCVRTWDDYLYE